MIWPRALSNLLSNREFERASRLNISQVRYLGFAQVPHLGTPRSLLETAAVSFPVAPAAGSGAGRPSGLPALLPGFSAALPAALLGADAWKVRVLVNRTRPLTKYRSETGRFRRGSLRGSWSPRLVSTAGLSEPAEDEPAPPHPLHHPPPIPSPDSATRQAADAPWAYGCPWASWSGGRGSAPQVTALSTSGVVPFTPLLRAAPWLTVQPVDAFPPRVPPGPASIRTANRAGAGSRPREPTWAEAQRASAHGSLDSRTDGGGFAKWVHSA